MFRFCNNKTNKEFIAAYFDSRKTLLEHNSPLCDSYLAKYPYIPNSVLQWWSVISNSWNMAHVDWVAMAADVTTTNQISFGNDLADHLVHLLGEGANHIPSIQYMRDCYVIMAIHVRNGEDYSYAEDSVYAGTMARATEFENSNSEYWEYFNRGCPTRSSIMYFWHVGYLTDQQLKLLLEPIDIEMKLESYDILNKVDLFDKFDAHKFGQLVERAYKVQRGH